MGIQCRGGQRVTAAGMPQSDYCACLPVPAGGALLAIDQGFMGPNYSISTACATANYAFVSGAWGLQLLLFS